MTTLILPVAGKSSRFPNMRPKWLLTMPSGNLMYEEALIDFPKREFDRIIVTCLREHLDSYASLDQLELSAKQKIADNVEFLVLDKPTASHSETVYETLVRSGVNGGFYLKDCDNRFAIEYIKGNSVASISLNEIDLIDAKNKSYIELDELGYVRNIVEKNVISSDFCCGGYSFASAKKFIESYKRLNGLKKQVTGEIYISHVIYDLLLQGEIFRSHRAEKYEDWGTLREYRHACRQLVTVFCDVDGVLLSNGSKFGPNGWATDPIVRNVTALKELQDKGMLFLVVTTSRPMEQEQYVLRKLSEYGLKVDSFVGGLPHSKRVLVNDFSATNPYPTSIAINLERNSEALGHHLIHLTA